MKRKLDQALRELEDSGKIRELRNKYWNNDAKCSARPGAALLTALTCTVSLLTALFLSR